MLTKRQKKMAVMGTSVALFGYLTYDQYQKMLELREKKLRDEIMNTPDAPPEYEFIKPMLFNILRASNIAENTSSTLFKAQNAILSFTKLDLSMLRTIVTHLGFFKEDPATMDDLLSTMDALRAFEISPLIVAFDLGTLFQTFLQDLHAIDAAIFDSKGINVDAILSTISNMQNKLKNEIKTDSPLEKMRIALDGFKTKLSAFQQKIIEISVDANRFLEMNELYSGSLITADGVLKVVSDFAPFDSKLIAAAIASYTIAQRILPVVDVLNQILPELSITFTVVAEDLKALQKELEKLKSHTQKLPGDIANGNFPKVFVEDVKRKRLGKPQLTTVIRGDLAQPKTNFQFAWEKLRNAFGSSPAKENPFGTGFNPDLAQKFKDAYVLKFRTPPANPDVATQTN